MAEAKFLFQAVKNERHIEAVEWVLDGHFDSAIISVAFSRSQGVGLILDKLKFNAKNITCYVGIRNDITSYQALELLLSAGVNLYVIDTGSKTTIFHPKIYFSSTNTIGKAVIGSANLTFGGLINNIESSAALLFDASDLSDRNFILDLVNTFENLKSYHPNHVTQISRIEDIENLYSQNLVVDETVSRKQGPPDLTTSHSDNLPLMRLFRRPPEPTLKRNIETISVDTIQSSGDRLNSVITNDLNFYLVWQSNDLTERDLNVPTGTNTNPTGSMLWKKGATKGIDQRHFFRDEIFNTAGWSRDPDLQHYERAYETFRIYTKGQYRGSFRLKLSHNTDTKSISYSRNNSMTSVSWGAALPIIAHRDLLDRTMFLYKKSSVPPEFIIEID